MDVEAQLAAIRSESLRMIAAQYALLNEELLPRTAGNTTSACCAPRTGLPRHAAWLGEYFDGEVEPVLAPLGLDPARPFPRIQNKSLNFVVELSGSDAFGRDATLAIVQVPRSLPRILRLPSEDPAHVELTYLSQVVEHHIERLFDGMRVTGCHQFRVTRNAELWVDDEETEDLLRAIEGELASRRYGDAVRLETSE